MPPSSPLDLLGADPEVWCRVFGLRAGGGVVGWSEAFVNLVSSVPGAPPVLNEIPAEPLGALVIEMEPDGQSRWPGLLEEAGERVSGGCIWAVLGHGQGGIYPWRALQDAAHAAGLHENCVLDFGPGMLAFRLHPGGVWCPG